MKTSLEIYLEFLRQYWDVFGPVPQRSSGGGQAVRFRHILL